MMKKKRKEIDEMEENMKKKKIAVITLDDE